METEISTTTENLSENKPTSLYVLPAAFLEPFNQIENVEEKLTFALQFMRTSLAGPTPRFKEYWEIRMVCVPLFKENLSAKARSELWEAYRELSAEARRLKELMDEQSAFAVEQIDLAIQALERDLKHYKELLLNVPDITSFSESPTIEARGEIYNQLQRELNLLNVLAARINSLRKEILKTEMRLRHKSRFFERLSKCGDLVFPVKKELIKKISTEFLSDIELFTSQIVPENVRRLPPLYAVRDEIKALQSIAKMLTLNTHTFTETRIRLSECWEHVRQLDKERKKEIAQRKQERAAHAPTPQPAKPTPFATLGELMEKKE
jgi:hypothetical protein